MRDVVGVCRARNRRAEVAVRHRLALAVRVQVPQIAIRDVVAVRVGPVARRVRHHLQDGRLIAEVDVLVRDDGHVAAKREFHRGLAGAEQIERRADARAEILEIERALHLRETRPLRKEQAAGERHRGDEASEAVVTQTTIERQSARRPLLLDVQPERVLPSL